MSAKATPQPGRRTPLSLTGAMSKGQSSKGSSNAANNSGNNANGHTATNNNKQDNKLQQQKTDQMKSNNSDIKENPNNKKVQQQQQSDKKNQAPQQQQHHQQQQQQNDGNKKSIEKNQNGVNNTKQQQNYENKQNQQPNKDSKQQNGNNNKSIENDKKEKQEKQQDKPEKSEAKSKDIKKSEPEMQEHNKKDEKKMKEVKDTKEENMVNKNEVVNKETEKSQNEMDEKMDDKKSKHEKDTVMKGSDQKLEEEKGKEMETTKEQQQKSPPSTPKANRTSKTSTAASKTPLEKTPQKSISNTASKTTPITKREVTTTIDDVEMEPLTVDSSPIKVRETQEVTNINIAPSATSTPGKMLLSKRSTATPKSDVQLAMQSGYSPERPRAFSQISGRKSIRPIGEYTLSKFQSNSQFRESYRRINTELDVTNTSMNVTVGSEVPNNLSFSFFGRGRKRDHASHQHSQSAIGELHTDIEPTPPKKARFEGFFSAVSSPLTLLRNRFSKATLQSSTPVKLEDKFNAAADEVEVQNVSGVSIHEDITENEKETEIDTASNKETEAMEIEVNSVTATAEDFENKTVKNEKACAFEKNSEQSDIMITETPLQVAVGDPLSKNKRCIVM